MQKSTAWKTTACHMVQEGMIIDSAGEPQERKDRQHEEDNVGKGSNQSDGGFRAPTAE